MDTIAGAWTVNRIGLWGPFGFGNMGNEMTLAAVLENLRRLHPAVALYGFSWCPEDTLERHGLSSFPVRRGGATTSGRERVGASRKNNGPNWKSRLQQFPMIYRAARFFARPLREAAFLITVYSELKRLDLDVLILAGTGPLTDGWGGTMIFPYNIFRWALLARLTRTKVVFLSVGAGPLEGWVSKCLIRTALAVSAYCSVRDHLSQCLVQSLGLRATIHVSSDLVFSLTVPDQFALPSATDQREVALTGIPYRKPGSWEHPDAAAYERYLNSMADFSCWLLQEGYKVRLVPTRVNMDQHFINDLKSRIQPRLAGAWADHLITDSVRTFADILTQFSRASIVITARFHGVVFSYLLGKPVLGVSYHPKMDALMADCGQGAYCVPLPTVSAEQLRERFRQLEVNRRNLSSHIHCAVRSYRDALQEQYRAVLQL